MSEITEACETCGGEYRHYRGCEERDRPFAPPTVQASTGRVPDVEATLRAQLDSERAKSAQLSVDVYELRRALNLAVATLSERDAEMSAAGAEVARLTEERDAWRAARDRSDDYVKILVAQIESLTTTLAERDGEVARLEGRISEVNRLLSDNGCDCDCDCDGDGHVCEREPCFPCRIQGALKELAGCEGRNEYDGELVIANERLAARLDRALRACHAVTYGDGGVTECAIVVDELENAKRLDEMRESGSND